MNERLRVRHEVTVDPGRDPSAPSALSTSANRQTLREILAAGLDRQILFGYELTRFEAACDGVRLHFAGGQQASADLLVGADGINSVVRQQLLPGARVIDTGSRCIYGKTPLSDSARYAAVQASREAETEMGTRHHGIAFWLYRHLMSRGRASGS